MSVKNKLNSMTEALKDREEVRAFLEAGKINHPTSTKSPVAPLAKAVESRIAVTLRLPEKIAHALIDESAERRKNRKENWSQQDIVTEAVKITWKVTTSDTLPVRSRLSVEWAM